MEEKEVHNYYACIKVVPDATFNLSDGSANTIKTTIT